MIEFALCAYGLCTDRAMRRVLWPRRDGTRPIPFCRAHLEGAYVAAVAAEIAIAIGRIEVVRA